MNWQPIESALKDRFILVYGGDGIDIANWGSLFLASTVNGKTVEQFGWVPKRGDCGSSIKGVTHWRTLPEVTLPPSGKL